MNDKPVASWTFVCIFAALCWSATAHAAYRCIPTCDTGDVKFLTLAGTNLFTLEGGEINASFVAPAGATSITIGIFDADTGGRWDRDTVPLELTLYADPAGDGTGSFVVGEWNGNAVNPTVDGDPAHVTPLWTSSAAIPPDHDWFEILVSTSPEAQTPGGAYYYRLNIKLQDATVAGALSNFKLRTDGTVVLKPFVFSFIAPMQLFDADLIYPNADTSQPATGWDVSGSPYDGAWDFHFYVSAPTQTLGIWDGDFDFGTTDGVTDVDTDDPNTSVLIPDFAAGTGVNPEGVAVGYGASTGNPPDDLTGIAVYARTPSVSYALESPTGTHYPNPNPSGNQEWENFVLTTDPAATVFDADFGPAVSADGATYVAGPILPNGVWHVHVSGLDMNNLNALNLDTDLLCVEEDGTPCEPPPPPNGGQGCTPGYWKNHLHAWVGHAPDDDYETTFGVDAAFSATLLEALAQGGGGETALGRHAVAALLNAASGDVSFGYTEPEVIAWVQAAYATGDFEPVKDRFDAENNLGCPLGNGKAAALDYDQRNDSRYNDDSGESPGGHGKKNRDQRKGGNKNKSG